MYTYIKSQQDKTVEHKPDCAIMRSLDDPEYGIHCTCDYKPTPPAPTEAEVREAHKLLTPMSNMQCPDGIGEAVRWWDMHMAALRTILAALDRAQGEVERERMRLAMCGVAAHGGSAECLPEYESDSLSAIIALRADLGKAEMENARLLDAIRGKCECCGSGPTGCVGACLPGKTTKPNWTPPVAE